MADQLGALRTSVDRLAALVRPADVPIRLVYGHLDPAHTPAVRGGVDLDDLRRAFPGI